MRFVIRFDLSVQSSNCCQIVPKKGSRVLSLSLSLSLSFSASFSLLLRRHRWPPTAQFTIKKQQETARHSKQIKKVLNLLQLFRLQQPVGLLNWIQVNQSLTASIWSNWIGNQLIYQLNYFTNSINLIWYFESNHFFSN